LSEKSGQEKDVEEKLRNLIFELRMLENVGNELQVRIGIVDSALRELNMAATTIQNLEKLKVGDELLIPTGANSYAIAKIANVERVLVGVGGGVIIEKPVKDAVSFLEDRANELNKARSSLQQQLSKVLERMEVLRREVEKVTGASKA